MTDRAQQDAWEAVTRRGWSPSDQEALWSALTAGEEAARRVEELERQLDNAQRAANALEGWEGSGCPPWARFAESGELPNLAAERDAALQRAAAAEREADRLRHGVPVEGDFVCPEEQRAADLERREVEHIQTETSLREEIDRLRFADATAGRNERVAATKIADLERELAATAKVAEERRDRAKAAESALAERTRERDDLAKSREEWMARCQEKSDDKADALQALASSREECERAEERGWRAACGEGASALRAMAEVYDKPTNKIAVGLRCGAATLEYMEKHPERLRSQPAAPDSTAATLRPLALDAPMPPPPGTRMAGQITEPAPPSPAEPGATACKTCGGSEKVGTGTPNGEGGEDYERCPDCEPASEPPRGIGYSALAPMEHPEGKSCCHPGCLTPPLYELTSFYCEQHHPMLQGLRDPVPATAPVPSPGLSEAERGDLEEYLKRESPRCKHADHGQRICVGCAARAAGVALDRILFARAAQGAREERKP